MKLFLSLLVMVSSLSMAGEQAVYQNWVVDSTGKSSEAHTVADANNSLGLYCANDQCLFYLRQGLNCSPGTKYSVLMNSPSVSTALTMECTLIGGNLFQILTPFDAVLRASQVGESIGFAVALQSGAFAVTRFSLLGAKPAIDRVLTEAANSRPKDQKPPQILIVPPIQIVPRIAPNTAPNSTPNLPQNTAPKSSSKDISI